MSINAQLSTSYWPCYYVREYNNDFTCIKNVGLPCFNGGLNQKFVAMSLIGETAIIDDALLVLYFLFKCI